jgi:hypothetical protein
MPAERAVTQRAGRRHRRPRRSFAIRLPEDVGILFQATSDRAPSLRREERRDRAIDGATLAFFTRCAGQEDSALPGLLEISGVGECRRIVEEPALHLLLLEELPRALEQVGQQDRLPTAHVLVDQRLGRGRRELTELAAVELELGRQGKPLLHVERDRLRHQRERVLRRQLDQREVVLLSPVLDHPRKPLPSCISVGRVLDPDIEVGHHPEGVDPSKCAFETKPDRSRSDAVHEAGVGVGDTGRLDSGGRDRWRRGRRRHLDGEAGRAQAVQRPARRLSEILVGDVRRHRGEDASGFFTPHAPEGIDDGEGSAIHRRAGLGETAGGLFRSKREQLGGALASAVVR